MSNADTTPAEPVGIFGGTFDPVHYGHLRCADRARQKLGLKNLYLLPAGNPAHRDQPQATAAQRLDMLALARMEFPRLKIDDRETRRIGPSYTVDTLQELRSSYPDRTLLLLIGQDVANDLHSWHRWQTLFDLAHIVILTRPAAHIVYRPVVAEQVRFRSVADVADLARTKAGSVLQLEVEPVDVSATDIKNHIRSGRKPKSMLPGVVLDYIVKNRLYLTA
jgi:nicotinate-nucleotide adenylyltransferase